MSAALLSENESTLSYDLLLLTSPKLSPTKKSFEQRSEEADGASTAEPETPCSASVIESISSAAPVLNNTIILCNVSHAAPLAEHAGLIAQTRELSGLVFDEDCLTSCTKKSHWKLSLLSTNDFATLCGFAVTKVTNGALAIAKIAVPVEFRGLGFGKLLMEDAIKTAKKQSDVFEVCLSSLSTAVTFYQRLGFKAYTGIKVKTDFEVVEGQVYMVKKLCGGRPRRRGGK